MRKIIYQIHLWLGLFVSIPVLAWAFSGFLYSLPNTVEGGKVDVIAQERVKISPNEAINKAHELAGKTLPTTALTLLMRDGKPFYQAVGGMGMDSILVNAETGEVLKNSAAQFSDEIFSPGTFLLFCGFVADYIFAHLFGVGVSFGNYRNLSKLCLLVWKDQEERNRNSAIE